MKKVLPSVFVLFLAIQLQAQEKTITGIVSDENGLALPTATILVKGTTNGTSTDFEGKYTIKANIGDILVYTYVGYVSTEKTVGALNTIHVSLQPDTSLDEVVVTAMGIKRERKSLGYVVSSLSGKVSGVAIKGKTSRVIIRGASSSTSDSIKENKPTHSQLTAGEINDLEKWEEWIVAVNKKKYKEFQNNWNFYLENRIVVVVRDANGNTLNNVKVLLYNESNDLIMSSRTDITGKAILFKDLHEKCDDIYFRIQLIQNGKVVGKKITKNHEELNFVWNDKKTSNDIDVMFTIDATGSMSDEINYLKAELKNIFNRINSSIEEKRIALTFYRDQGDAYVVKDFDFNSNINTVKDILSQEYAGGGGDYEEAVEEALKVSMQKSWNVNAKAKLLFLLLDAPPHFTEKNVRTIKTQIRLAQEKGIKIIPIVASDANKEVEFLMRFFSISTNGTYVFLTDDSGIGNSHIKPTTDDFKVEKLNDLIVRLIEKYSGVIS